MRGLALVFLVVFSLVLADFRFGFVQNVRGAVGSFGYPTIGTTGSNNIENTVAGSVFTCPDNANVTSITAYLEPLSGYSQPVKAAIYKHSDLSLVGNTTETTVFNPDGAYWVSFSFTVYPILSAGTDYILAVWGKSGIGTCPILSDDGSTNQSHTQAKTYVAAWANPMVPVHGDRSCSIYCNYTVIAGNAPTNDACDSTATFTVNIDSWVNMTVSDASLVADLAMVMIAVTAADSKTFNLTWTQATNTFAETLDASGICTLNTTSSVRVNLNTTQDKIAFLFQISVAAQSGACSVEATSTDDGSLSDVDTYAAEFAIASYSVLTFLAGNSTHTWVNATSGTNDNLLDQGAIYFNVTANFTFKIQAKGDGNLIKGTDYIGLGNVTIHEDTLGSSTPLTTDYADVGGLTSQAMGEDLTLNVKVWLDIPANQPVGNYVYVLTLQVTSQ